MANPRPVPSSLSISEARSVLRSWQLHYYQLLYFHEPKLTQPGRNAGPFSVEFEISDTTISLVMVCKGYPEYKFTIPANISSTPEEFDEEILRKCNLILETIKTGAKKADSRMCCSLAIRNGCVCFYSYKCVLHGEFHIGTHD